ncbi:HxlR family transcriptional regulator [Kineosporia sp. NBRC 101677]|uniref:winged helix-turn-helix transcriptional regulator n=1 Tax=Kineosporia sp. NBRC 101677 TaxID=3032197 RepID=UPI0024A24403|nr:helix-turn-helix domain-containing protein [Kineosporia sp. NBRC 101677]GLY15181.1 HxlR family transcriptional regulator [Kineosporia sp. NBRC 101677]
MREEHCDQFVADCRLRAATELFAHTWDVVVMAALRDGPLRRRELRARIGAISDKVLTETLQRLTGHGLVAREPGAGLRIDYRLTALGASLLEGPLRALGVWMAEHGDELLPAQELVREEKP